MKGMINIKWSFEDNAYEVGVIHTCLTADEKDEFVEYEPLFTINKSEKEILEILDKMR